MHHLSCGKVSAHKIILSSIWWKISYIIQYLKILVISMDPIETSVHEGYGD